MNYRKLLVLIFSLVIGQGVIMAENNWETKVLSTQELYNLSALSEAYGYIRYFYPNPQFEKLNWINFLILAQSDLKDVKTDKDLIAKLQILFSPLCREVQFSTSQTTKSEVLSPPYYIIENKGIGSLVKMTFGKNYSSIRYVGNSVAGMNYFESNTYKLNDNLYITFPLALKKRPIISPEFSTLKLKTDSLKLTSLSTFEVLFNKKKVKRTKPFFYLPEYRIADIMVRRNIIQHFYPYFKEDKLEEIWDSACMNTIKQVAEINSKGAYYDEIYRLSGLVHDSHLLVWNSFLLSPNVASYIQNYNVDMAVQFCGDTCYVDGVNSTFSEKVSRADRLLLVNNRPINELVEDKLTLTPSSTRLSGLGRIAALGTLFETYKSDSTVKVSVLKSNGETVEVELKTKAHTNIDQYLKPLFFKRLDNNIIYLNVCSRDSFNYKNLVGLIPAMQNSNGIIMDVRGYPGVDILPTISHFLNENIKIGNLYSPIIRYPNQQDIEYIEVDKWGIAPAVSVESALYSKKYQYTLPVKQAINKPIIFLANAKAQSFAETFLDMMKHYKVGIIIGEPTAGCNGDVTKNDLPFGTFFMTYNKFLNRDGSQHHGIGVLPDIYCKPTLTDIQKGLDTQLNFAVEYLNKQNNLSK